MHVGERPYVVVGTQTINISTHGLNLDAMTGMLTQLLPADALAQLEEFGAVEYRVPQQAEDRFTIVAARGGDDVWIEIRRRRSSNEAPKPQAAPAVTTPPAPPPVVEAPAIDAAMAIEMPPPIEVPMMPAPAAESLTAAETSTTSSQVLAEFLSEPEPIIEYVPRVHEPEPVVEAIPVPAVESIPEPVDPGASCRVSVRRCSRVGMAAHRSGRHGAGLCRAGGNGCGRGAHACSGASC